MLPAAPKFESALPVWPEGRSTEMNMLVEFRATFAQPQHTPVLLRLTGATEYRIRVNGQFVGFGPARAGHGFYRVDEIDLTRWLRVGNNDLLIEVAGYNVNSYALLDQPSFLQAEVMVDTEAILATGVGGFETRVRRDRVQKTQRYSFQRPFSEIWLVPGPAADLVVCTPLEPKPLAPRRVPYSTFEVRPVVAHLTEGEMKKNETAAAPWKDRSLTAIGPKFKGYPEAELSAIPSLELQTVTTASSRPAAKAPTFSLKPNSYRILDFGVNATGFIGLQVNARSRTRLFVTFDEILTKGDVDFKRLDCVNIVQYELEPGAHVLESFEPYTLRYLKLIVLEGECEVSGTQVREFVNPTASRAQFEASDARFNQIFAAARETFGQNANDIFMDCPSRERAGWLCDSFFTARVAADLTGETAVEKNFLENYQRPATFAFLPDGMLPMCYPADHYDGVFIPNWAMWFVLQLAEYADRSGDRELVEALRPRVQKLLEFFRRYENEDGLLEKLPSWVFVEWSQANKFVQDVSYPSNMLYAAMLDAADRLYHEPGTAPKAARLRDTIRRQSFDGEFFVDNAVRTDGKLHVTRNRSEVCQYFAFYCDVATPTSHPELWRRLITDFGPPRKQSGAFAEIWPANAFVGNQLRFELLSRYRRNQQILDEAIGYWLYMAERTGTLWEHDSTLASCSHGFASHAAHTLIRDVLGIASVDTVKKTVRLRIPAVTLSWCKGSIPTPDGPIDLRWFKKGEKVKYRLSLPPGFQVEVENLTGQPLERE
ncbi:MAG: alpha-L-rhamnosidase C-terminal domain-containing protein [Opitutus sp.]